MGRVRAAASRFGLLCAAGLALASCVDAPPPPPPPQPVTPWPTHGWQTSTPEAQGIDSKWLTYAIQMIQWKHLPVHSLLIERHGSIVLDAYFYPFADNELHDVASVTKSVVSTLVGIAQAKQQIADLNTPVLPVLNASASASDERKTRLTLAHLLSMTSGLDCSAKDGQNFLQQMESSAHWSLFALERPETADPGTQFNYCAVNMQLVSALLSRKTGESAAQFAQRELFGPLGIHSVDWPSDPDGVSHGFADLKLQPRDMAKLGYLWLHHGVWEGRQIVPQSYLDAALSPHADVNVGVKYGYGIWLYPNGRAGGPADFEANGHGGQRIAVIPSKDTVIVITGNGLNDNDVAKLLAPAARWDAPLPPNPQANAQLASLVTQAATPQDVRLVDATAKFVPVSMAPTEQSVPAQDVQLANTGAKSIPVPLPQDTQAVPPQNVQLADIPAKSIPVPLPRDAQAAPAQDVQLADIPAKSIPVPLPRDPHAAPAQAVQLTDPTAKFIPVPLPRPSSPALVAQAATPQDATPTDSAPRIALKDLPVPIPRPSPPAALMAHAAAPQDVILADGTARIVPAALTNSTPRDVPTPLPRPDPSPHS